MTLSFFASLAFLAEMSLFEPKPLEPLKDEEKSNMEILVKNLGAENAKERKLARSNIAALGPKYHKFIDEIIMKSEDVEVKETLREILAGYELKVSWKDLSAEEQKFISDLKVDKKSYEFNIEMSMHDLVGLCVIQEHILIFPNATFPTKSPWAYGRSKNRVYHGGDTNTSMVDQNEVIVFNSKLTKVTMKNELFKNQITAFGLTLDLSEKDIHLFNPDGSYRGKLIERPETTETPVKTETPAKPETAVIEETPANPVTETPANPVTETPANPVTETPAK